MEIKSVENKLKNEYPTINEMSKKKVKKNIPLKWSKVGLTSTVLAILINNMALGIANDFPILAGEQPIGIEEPRIISVSEPSIISVILPIIQSISLVTLILATIAIIIPKFKTGNFSDKKLLKGMFIGSLIVFLISFIVQFFINNIL